MGFWGPETQGNVKDEGVAVAGFPLAIYTEIVSRNSLKAYNPNPYKPLTLYLAPRETPNPKGFLGFRVQGLGFFWGSGFTV